MGDAQQQVWRVGRIVEFSSLGADVQEIIRKAEDVYKRAYCPYSKFQVGSAILCGDGSIVDGCNVESGAPGTICAERTAIVKAVSDGKMEFLKLAVVAKKVQGEFTAPCGSCRQFIVEFARNGINTEIFLSEALENDDPKKGVLVTSIKEILPLHFDLKNDVE